MKEAVLNLAMWAGVSSCVVFADASQWWMLAAVLVSGMTVLVPDGPTDV